MPLGGGHPELELTLGGVQCTIVEDGIRERWQKDQPAEADVTFKCKWADRYKLIAFLRGTSTVAGGKIVRHFPFRYPSSPNLICLGIGEIYGIKVRRDAFNWQVYDWAIVPAHFEVPTWGETQQDPGAQNDPSGQPWTITKFKVSGEFFKPPGGRYIYAATGQPVKDGDVGIVLPKCEISITKKWLPYVPVNFFMANVGTLNANAFSLSDNSFPRGTVLLAGMNAEPNFDGAGNQTWDVEFTLIANGSDPGGNPIDWNNFMPPGGTIFLTIQDSNGTPPYLYSTWPTLMGLF